MPLSDDVLRGLRWGAILLAGLAIGVACYRLIQESPPKVTHVEPAQEVAAPVAPAKKSNVKVERPAPAGVANVPVPAPPAR